VRASVLSIREQDFVAADSALGVRDRRILWHRVFPNSLTPLVVQATLGIATAVLEIAALSFLGLGVQPPTAEWGSMLAAERNNVFTAFFLVLFPGIMIMINVLPSSLGWPDPTPGSTSERAAVEIAGLRTWFFTVTAS
jgi:peptide/nickel transport system permease protein